MRWVEVVSGGDSCCLPGKQGLFKHLHGFQNADCISSSPNQWLGFDMNGRVAQLVGDQWQNWPLGWIWTWVDTEPIHQKRDLFLLPSLNYLITTFIELSWFQLFPLLLSRVCCCLGLEGWRPFPVAVTDNKTHPCVLLPQLQIAFSLSSWIWQKLFYYWEHTYNTWWYKGRCRYTE